MIAEVLESMPIIAILRGIRPEEATDVGNALYDNGVRCVEVTLNSPSPFDSIEKLAESLPEDCVVGGGTVIAPEDVGRVRDAGGRIIVSPNTSPAVIQTAIAAEMDVLPGVATPTDAFLAVELGAGYLKLFPACTYGPGHVTSMIAPLPKHVRFLAVGGINPKEFKTWLDAGVIGFGIGSELYRAGDSVVEVEKKVAAIRAALQ
jgi:2-dehydro-3-deoxyphosphogalactonate aldolase